MGKFKDLTGNRFGMWKVIKVNGYDNQNKILWLCECECGNERNVSGNSLRSGRSNSCGCYDFKLNKTKHFSSDLPEYRIWKAMKTRCDNPNADNFIHYGAKGIKVCERWQIFENFYKDMGSRPTVNHSIDRINVNGNYEPNNCRWVTHTQQVRNVGLRKDNLSGCKGVVFNTKSNKWTSAITINGKRMHLGYYNELEEAIKVRKNAEIEYWN